jgi:hypothetical protein
LPSVILAAPEVVWFTLGMTFSQFRKRDHKIREVNFIISTYRAMDMIPAEVPMRGKLMINGHKPRSIFDRSIIVRDADLNICGKTTNRR